MVERERERPRERATERESDQERESERERESEQEIESNNYIIISISLYNVKQCKLIQLKPNYGSIKEQEICKKTVIILFFSSLQPQTPNRHCSSAYYAGSLTVPTHFTNPIFKQPPNSRLTHTAQCHITQHAHIQHQPLMHPHTHTLG